MIKNMSEEFPIWKDHKKYPRDIKDVLYNEFVKKLEGIIKMLDDEDDVIMVRELKEEYEDRLKREIENT